MMKTLVLVLITLLLLIPARAQKPDDIVATANGRSWAIKDLSPNAQEAAGKFPELVSTARRQLLAQAVGELLLETEAKARGITPQQLVKLELKKMRPPTPVEIKAVYDRNSDKLVGKTLDEVRPQIIEFLRQDKEETTIKAFVDTLAVKYKGTYPKDVNAPGLKPADVLFAAAGRSITVKTFEDENSLRLYGINADFYSDMQDEAAETVYNQLVLDEAKAQKLGPSELIAQEVSSKFKDFTDEERATVEAAFRDRLFAKYSVKLLVKVPEAPIQNISVDDDPAKGPATAPVTIVMFSDFQCSACSAAHPLLQQAMAPFADKIHFVVRDYPLETLHPNAFHAALAANAARSQGKFFEYVDILYKNQQAQDDASLKKYAADLGLNAAQFAIDFSSEKTAAEVREDMADGRGYGITGTPSIFVNGRYVRELSVAGFTRAIEAALTK